MNARAAAMIGAAVAILVTAGAVVYWNRALESDGTAARGIASIGGPFALIDQDGRPRTDGDFRNEILLVYFGFTYCPDACPTALNAMSQALDRLGERAAAVRPILISIDPARDTPEQLKLYGSNFHPRLVLLTGSSEQVARAAKAYRVYYAKVKETPGTTDYLMDHTSIIYLMGKDGRYLTHFTHVATADQIAATLRKYL